MSFTYIYIYVYIYIYIYNMHIYIYICIYYFPSGSSAGSQKAWDTPIVDAAVHSLTSSADSTSRARLLAAQQKESGAWLSAPPISSLGLRLDDDCVRVAVGLRLGCSLCLPHDCPLCGDRVEESGLHGLSCRRSKGRLPRHSALNDIVKWALSAVNIAATLEPRGLCRSDGKRPDGVSIIPWSDGQYVSCVGHYLP